MCVIAIYETNFPLLSDLESMQLMNNDGAGFAFLDNNKVHYIKGLKLTAKEIFNYITDNDVKLPIIVHFRIKSSGILSDDLSHPHEVAKKQKIRNEGLCDKVLFHNGTNYKWDEYLLQTCMNLGLKVPDGDLSDSKALAFLCSIYGDNFLQLVGNNGRFCIFSKHGIKKYGEWIENNKTVLSNDNHIEKPTKNYFNYFDESKVEKIKVKNSSLTNVWKNGVLQKIEDYNGNVVKSFESITDKVDNMNISNMSFKEQMELNKKTKSEIEIIDSRLMMLETNLTEYQKNQEDPKIKKKIKTTLKRIDGLNQEKLVKELIIDDLFQIINNDDLGLMDYGF